MILRDEREHGRNLHVSATAVRKPRLPMLIPRIGTWAGKTDSTTSIREPSPPGHEQEVALLRQFRLRRAGFPGSGAAVCFSKRRLRLGWLWANSMSCRSTSRALALVRLTTTPMFIFFAAAIEIPRYRPCPARVNRSPLLSSPEKPRPIPAGCAPPARERRRCARSRLCRLPHDQPRTAA